MDIIERYIYTATKRLSEKTRTDVEAELKSIIYDMLPEAHTEADVHKVLFELGNPVDLGNQYRDGSQHLIGPAFYDRYLYVLKIVFAIVGCIAPIAAFLSVLFEQSVAEPLAILGNTLLRTLIYALQGGFQAFAWVTVIFALLDRVKILHMKWPYTGEEWSLEDLEEPYTQQGGGIERSEPAFTIIITLIITGFISFFSQHLAWYRLDNGRWTITPVFDLQVLQGYIPFILGLAVFATIFAVLQLIYRKWTLRLAILNGVYNLCGLVFSASFLLNERLFNSDFKTVFAGAVQAELDFFEGIWQGSIWGLLTLIFAMGIWSTVSGFRSMRKAART